MKLMCESWSSDGTMSVLIYTNDHKTYRYEYTVDAAFIPDWRKRMQYQPAIVLNEIKKKATIIKRVY